MQLLLQGVLLLERLQRLLRAMQGLLWKLQLLLWKRVLMDVLLQLLLRKRMRLLGGVRLLRWQLLLLQLHDLLGLKVQRGVLGWLLGRRLQQVGVRGPLGLAEQHCAGVAVPLLAVVHLLVQVFRRC